MGGLKYNKIIKYKLRAVCNSPLHIGSSIGGKEEVLIDPIERKPFIQASSLAGVFRSTYAKNHSEEQVDKLFGASHMKENDNSADKKSRIIFSDGHFEDHSLKIEIRPHVSINRETGSVSSANHSGQKFNMEYVGAGAVIETSVYLYDGIEESFVDDFESILAIMKSGELSIGAKKSSGAGKISLEYAGKIEFDLLNNQDRQLWMEEESLDSEQYQNITELLCAGSSFGNAYKVIVRGKTEGAILVKGIATSAFGKNAPDVENIKNAREEYILPGSSYRGAIRAQMEKIADYLNKRTIIDEAFGFVGKEQNESKAGNLIFNDTVIHNEEQDPNVLRHRIHIDKFTGGVMNSALFSEKNTCGALELTIDILDKNHPTATLGLLMLALRDLSIKAMNLGSGYATGKGFIDVEEIEIFSTDCRASIVMKDGKAELTDEKDLLKNALSKLKEVS